MAEVIEVIYEQRHITKGVFDVVPVQRLVRCKDCKWFSSGYCMKLDKTCVSPKAFCSWAEGVKNERII